MDMNVVDDDRSRKEMKRHRLEGNRGRKKYHYVFNQKENDIRLPRPDGRVVNTSEEKITG